MKKKLEAELISIAHRILKLKNRDDVHELHHEAQKLYEKLSVLLFIEDNFGEIKPTIGLQEIERKLEKAFDFDDKIVVAEIKEEDSELIVDSKIETPAKEVKSKEVAAKVETAKEEIIFEEPKVEAEATPAEIVIEEEPAKEVVIEQPKAEVEAPIIEIPKPDKKQISFDDILGNMQPEPIFDRISKTEKPKETKIPEEISKIIEEKIEVKAEEKIEEKIEEKVEVKINFEPKLETAFIDSKPENDIFFEKVDAKPATNLNDKLNKGINIGLNDRIAFEKNLFGGSSEDFNRVVSQLSTFDSLEDAKNFINEMVKPDYDDWKGQDEFAARFMEFVENKFV